MPLILIHIEYYECKRCEKLYESVNDRIGVSKKIQGQNKMNITWTNCAEQMPPDDETEIIIRHVEDNELILTPANEVFYDIDTLYKDVWEWTEFSEEKWALLG